MLVAANVNNFSKKKYENLVPRKNKTEKRVFAEVLIETKRRTRQSQSAHVRVWVRLINALTNGDNNHTI